MRLHTSLTAGEVVLALGNARKAGEVHPSVRADSLSLHGSRTHKRAFEVQLGSSSHEVLDGEANRYGLPQKTRRVRNGKARDGERKWSATYGEWGHFIAVVYEMDPKAVFAGSYESREDFHEKTGYRFYPDND